MASPYLLQATDGTDLGADMATITALTTIAQTGDRRSVTETRPSSGWFSYNGVQRVQYPRTLINSDLPSWSTLSGLTQHSVSGDTALRALITGTALVTGGHVVIVDHTVTYTGDYFGIWPARTAGDQVPGGSNTVYFFSKAIWDSMVANSGVATVCPEKKRVTSGDLANLVYFKCGDGLGQFAVYAQSAGLAIPTNGFRFVGFRFGVDPSLGQVSHLVQLGSGDGAVQNKPSQLASNLGLDRCWFDGHAGCDIRHGVEFHCKYFYAVDCGTGPDIHVQYNSEGHVFCGYNGPGPGRLVNNLITGGTQYIFFGGAASPCGSPSDIEVRYNYCTRPASWVTSPWFDKCGIEAKKWAYSIIEGNIIENVRSQSQIGAAFLLKSENYDSVQPTTTDLLVRYNLVRNVAHGITFAGVANGPLAPAVRIISYSNLYLVGAAGYYAEPNSLIGPYYSTDSGCIHDTFVCEQSQNAIGQPPQGTGGPTNLVLRDCIFAGTTTYGLKPDSGAEGVGGLIYPDVTKSVFQGRLAGNYPAGNFFPANLAAIQFTNTATKDYSLLGTAQTGGGTVTPVATSLRIVVQPSGGNSGAALTTQPQVEIVDQFGNRFSSTATITATSVSGSVSDTNNTKAAVAGLATFTALTGTAGATAATTWTFSSPGLTSVTSNSVTITVPVATAVATALRVVTQPGGAVSGVALTQQPSVEVIDQYGQRITSTATITATAMSNVSVATVAGSTKAAVAGLAAFTALAMTTTQDGWHAWFTFSSPGLTSVDSNSFIVSLFTPPVPTPDPVPAPEPPPTTTPDPVPASLVVTRAPGPANRIYSGRKFPQQPIVEARTADGSVMTSYNGPMTAYLDDSATATLRGTVTVTAIAGVGRWSNLGLGNVSGPVEIHFTDGPEPPSVT